MGRKVTILGVAVVLFALVVSACSSDEQLNDASGGKVTAPLPAGEGRTVCDLLTEAQVATVVGPNAHMVYGRGYSAELATSCDWRQEGGDRILVLTVRSAGADEYPTLKRVASDAQEVAGLSSAGLRSGTVSEFEASAVAGFSALTATGPLVVATDGSRIYLLDLLQGTETDLPALETLAGQAVANRLSTR